MSFFKNIVYWMQESWLGELAREVYWVFPAAEIVHFFGLCLLMGAILVVDLRLLGFAKSISLRAVLKLVPVAIIGIVLNVLSGIVFLCAYPENYWPATAFWLKLLAFFIGAANALFFEWKVVPKILAEGDFKEVGAGIKKYAVVSLAAWTIVIVIGRFLPFVSVSTS